MKIEIDQSGKVENTATHTVVGDSLGNSLLLSAQNKRELLALYRIIGRPRIFAFEIYGILVAVLIKITFRKEHQYIIDKEYVGKDDDIKRFVLLSLRDLNIPINKGQIHFSLIGKKSQAHSTSYHEFIEPKASQKVSIRQILRLIHP